MPTSDRTPSCPLPISPTQTARGLLRIYARLKGELAKAGAGEDVMAQSDEARRVMEHIAGLMPFLGRQLRPDCAGGSGSRNSYHHEGEALIHKQFNSAFEQTSLDAELAGLGATHIVLAGAVTHWCIRATAYGALDRGYDLTLVRDAHTTESMQLDGGVTIEAANVIQELNIAMKWLEYPGRKNGTASANELNFALPGGIK